MNRTSPLPGHSDRARWNIVELLTALRLVGGALLASIAAAAVLYAPDQVRELYRIAATDRNVAEIAFGLGALTLMSVVFWWVSDQIVVQCGPKVSTDAPVAQAVLATAPILIGVLPPIAAALGMLASRPVATTTPIQIGSPWQGLAELYTVQLGSGLLQGAIAAFGIAAFVVAVAVVVRTYAGNDPVLKARRHRDTGFFTLIGLLVSVAIVVVMSIAVLWSPVRLPQAIGTLPLLAAFFIAIMLMIGQMTVWQEATGVPYLVVLAIMALGFAALDLNDNHEIRAVASAELTVAPEQLKRWPTDSWQAFRTWYRARPQRDRYKDTYPIYIVAAQGGGIYAAYHTGALLARLQDLCPRFRDHLFAISSVSGGSLGAGVFAAVTKALARDQPASAVAASSEPAPATTGAPTTTAVGATDATACPELERLARSEFIAGNAGSHEKAVAGILRSDYLAPLAAGTLFPDFTQRFLPFPVPAFDRARWLEASFEESWKAARLSGPNPLQESALKLWSPDGAAPALLINATESDSGRRLLISPFRVGALGDDGEMLQFPLWNTSHSRFHQGGAPCSGRDIPLSTAIGLSARFPWLTPAGSLTSNCNPDRKQIKTRIVDGGYFDNSGVDTAIDVISQLTEQLSKTDFRLDGPGGPRIEIHLIVLTTSDFPTRSGYGLGDGLEPIRALLSTRTARTPIAINQAKRRLAQLQKVSQSAGRDGPHKVQLPHIHETRFRDTIYRIPLGWRLSQASRDILNIQSGRFWDCDAGANHEQRDKELSNADCIQLMVYYQLEDSMPERLQVVSLLLNNEHSGLRAEIPPFDMNSYIQCYAGALARPGANGKAGRILQPRHVRSIRGILQAWSRGQDPRRENHDWLAFALALADLEAAGLPLRAGGCLSEKCTLRTLNSYGPVFRNLRFGKDNLDTDSNGKRYYGRGYIQLAGIERYKSLAGIIRHPLADQPDLLLVPVISGRALIAWLVDERINPTSTLDKFTTTSADGTKALDVEGALKAFVESRLGPNDATSPLFKAVVANAAKLTLNLARPKVRATYATAKACIAQAKATKRR